MVLSEIEIIKVSFIRDNKNKVASRSKKPKREEKRRDKREEDQKEESKQDV